MCISESMYTIYMYIPSIQTNNYDVKFYTQYIIEVYNNNTSCHNTNIYQKWDNSLYFKSTNWQNLENT